MVRLSIAVSAVLFLAASVRADDQAPTKSQPRRGAPRAPVENEKQKGSYSIGYAIGTNLRSRFGPGALDTNAFLQGMQEAIMGAKSSMPDADRERALQMFSAQLRRNEMNAANAVAERNKKQGEDFLAANKLKPGVKTLASGLQYMVLKEGTGKQPKATDEVKVHYHGTLLNGKVFDSSVDRGEPATFQLNRVIPGWTEAVQHMKQGAKWRVFIPPALAYGERGAGPGGPIGPNETLIFEIELLKVP